MTKSRHHQSVGKRPFQSVKKQATQLKELRIAFNRAVKKQLKASGNIEDKSPYVWEWVSNDQSGTVTALTGSEARAEIKKVLGKKLPRDLQIERIDFNESAI